MGIIVSSAEDANFLHFSAIPRLIFRKTSRMNIDWLQLRVGVIANRVKMGHHLLSVWLKDDSYGSNKR